MGPSKSVKGYQAEDLHSVLSAVASRRFWPFRGSPLGQVDCHAFAMKSLMFEEIEIFKAWQRPYDAALGSMTV